VRDVGAFGAEAGFDDALPGFATVRRGYDPAQVRAALVRLAEELRRARSREEDLRDRVRELESRPPPLPQELDEETLVRALGEETASVLRSAREAARELREHAAAEAERVREVAVAEAERVRAEATRVAHVTTEEAEGAANEIRRRAEAEADRTVAEARREADRLVEQARAEGQALLRKAQEMRTSVLADLAERRRILTAQVDALRAGRDSLVDSFRATRAALDRIDENLARAEIDAKLAADRAGPRPAERGGRPSHGSEPEAMAGLPIGSEGPERTGARDDGGDTDPGRSPEPRRGTSDLGDPAGVVAPPEGRVIGGAPASPGADADGAAATTVASRPTASLPPRGDARPEAGPPPPAVGFPAVGSETASWPGEVDVEGVRILGARRAGDRVGADDDDRLPRSPGGPGGDAPTWRAEATSQIPAVVGIDVPAPTPPDPVAAKSGGVEDGAGPSAAGPDPGGTRDRSGVDRAEEAGPTPGVMARSGLPGQGRSVASDSSPRSFRASAESGPAGSGSEGSGSEGSGSEDSDGATVVSAAGQGVTPERPLARSRPTGTVLGTEGRSRVSRGESPAGGRGEGNGDGGRPGSLEARSRADERAEEVDALFARLRAERATPPPAVRAEAADSGEASSEPPGEAGRRGGVGLSSAAASEADAVGEDAPGEEEVGPARPDGSAASVRPASPAAGTAAAHGLRVDEEPGFAELRGSEEGPEPAAAPLDAEERGALDRRDQRLAPVAAGVARRVRRILQDEQNQLLDLLRHLEGPVVGRVRAELEAVPGRHRASLQQLLAPAFGAGLESAGGRRRRGPSEEDVTGKEAERLLETLVASVARRVEADAGDADAVAATVSSAFREWRGERVETLVLDHVLSVFESGQLAAASREAAFRWVPSDDGGACSDCDDDRLAGPVRAGSPFPTGHTHPPAHSGCRCHLLEVRP